MDEFDEGGWEPPNPEELDAWRGTEHAEGDAWRGTEQAEPEVWRGVEHTGTWPENMAGPEYWLFRAREEVERIVSELVGERTATEE